MFPGMCEWVEEVWAEKERGGVWGGGRVWRPWEFIVWQRAVFCYLETLGIFIPRFVAGGLPPGSGVTVSQRLSGYLVRAAAGRCVCACQCSVPLHSSLSSYLSSAMGVWETQVLDMTSQESPRMRPGSAGVWGGRSLQEGGREGFEKLYLFFCILIFCTKGFLLR